MSIDLFRRNRQFLAAVPSYDQSADLQQEVGRRMLERLELVRLQPRVIVDLGCASGFCTHLLRTRYRGARVVALDLIPAMVGRYRKSLRWFRRFDGVAADAAQLPFATASCDLLFANMLLHWSDDPAAWFQEFRRVLKPGGLLMFSGLGPDTLCELRRCWAAVDTLGHVHSFIDMHDYGDRVLAANFSDPVMDVENFTLTYDSVAALGLDLRHAGATNSLMERRRSLTGKRRYAAMVDTYEQERVGGLLPATFEVFYGHAWVPIESPKPAQQPGEFSVPVSSIGRRR